MSNLLRTLAAAAATACLPLAATAASVPISQNFEALGAASQAALAGIALSNQVEGLTFSSGGGFVEAVYTGLPVASFVPANPRNPTNQGYLLARADFAIEVANEDSRFLYDTLRFNFAVPATGVDVVIRLISGSSVSEPLFPSPGDFGWGTAVKEYRLAVGQVIDRIEFSSLRGDLFVIDDLQLSLSTDCDVNCPPVGVLPEPAGFGLLGLMLLSAGWTSRRIRRNR